MLELTNAHFIRLPWPDKTSTVLLQLSILIELFVANRKVGMGVVHSVTVPSLVGSWHLVVNPSLGYLRAVGTSHASYGFN